MRFFKVFVFLLVVAWCHVGRGQGQKPPVTEIYKTYDGNNDGVLEANEVASSRYAR